MKNDLKEVFCIVNFFFSEVDQVEQYIIIYLYILENFKRNVDKRN